MTNVLMLFNAASENGQDGLKTFSLYKQDNDILRAVRKLGVNASVSFVEEGEIGKQAGDSDVILNFADGYWESQEAVDIVKRLERTGKPFTG